MMLGKFFGLGASNSKDRNDSENRASSIGGPAVTTIDPRISQSGKKAARQKINQKLADAFSADFDED